jgi:hypothetical protein
MKNSAGGAVKERVATALGEMWLEDGILFHRIDTAIVQPAEAALIGKAVQELTGGRKVPAVIDIRTVAFAEKEARQMFAGSTEESYEIATALIVAPGSSSAMGQVFLKIDKPSRPVGVFTSKAEAVAWARSFRDDVD